MQTVSISLTLTTEGIENEISNLNPAKSSSIPIKVLQSLKTLVSKPLQIYLQLIFLLRYCT